MTTIIVLLILAGVTINIALGENGLFNQTKLAIEKYKNAANQEEQELELNFMDLLANVEVREDGTPNLTAEQWTQISNGLTDLEDIKRRLSNVETSKANASDVQSELNNKANVSDLNNYYTKDEALSGVRDVLYSTPIAFSTSTANTAITSNNTITFDDISSYKYIEIQYESYLTDSANTGWWAEEAKIIPVDQITYNNSDTIDWTNSSSILLTSGAWGHENCLSVYFKNATTLKVAYAYASTGDWTQMRINKICGIK